MEVGHGRAEEVRQLREIAREETRRYNEVYARYKREMLQRRKLHNELMEMRSGGSLRLMLRVRPLLPREERAEELTVAEAVTYRSE